MSEEKALSTIVTFGVDHSPVRVVFPNLFKPKAIKDRKGNERGDPKYSATFRHEGFCPSHDEYT